MSTSDERRILSADEYWVSINRLSDAGGWPAIFGRTAPLEIEIGFGWDPFLLDEAQRRPEVDFVGLEYDRKRVEAFVDKAIRRGILNVRVVFGDACYCLPRMFHRYQIRRACIHFPDPWHKKRQQKNRLLDVPFLTMLFYHFQLGGELVIGTDSVDYGSRIGENLAAIEGITNLNAPDPWVDRLADHPETKFEQLFRQQGKPIHYFHYRREPGFDDHYGAAIGAEKAKLPRRMDDMPHAVFDGKLDLSRILGSFTPLIWQDDLAIYKVTEVWLASRRSVILFECLIVSEGTDSPFFVEISIKNKGTVLRVSPMRDIERNELVFRFMAHLVTWLAGLYPDTTVLRHNLGDFYPGERASDP